jgi:hypothetical protein
MTALTPLARYSAVEGALASGFVTAELHHAVGHDPIPGVHDAAVRLRTDIHDDLVTVIYLVANPVPSDAQLRVAMGALEAIWETVVLSDWPHDGDGQLDEQKLRTYPVVSPRHVAAMVGSGGEPISVRHGLHKALHWKEADTVIVHGTELSLVHGEPLGLDPAGRTCLSDALAFVASTKGDDGIRLIGADGADSSLTYRCLHDAAMRIAGGIKALDQGEGSVLLMQVADPGTFIAVFWGAIYLERFVGIR